MRAPFSLLLIVALAQGCKDRDESLVKEFLKRPVSGMVDGDEWEVKYAYIDPTAKTPKEDDYAFILLNYKPEKPCPKITSIPEGAVTAMVSAPQQKSKRALRLKSGTARSLVFQWQKDKKPFAIVAKTGRIQIISSSGRTLKAKVQARYNSENWLNGYFTADICAYRDMTDFSEDVFE